MLLLTLSVLAAHADQEGNARWCNIDSHGCYLNEEGGVKSYMYFWTVESCKYFMGNDNLCKNVVPRYYSADGRHPLEKAPEPAVHQPKPAVLLSVSELYELLLPNGIAVFNGALILTGDAIRDSGVFTGLQAASGSELLIPVFSMSDPELSDLSGAGDFTLSDFLQMEVFAGTANAKAVIMTGEDSYQSAVLVKDMDRPEGVTLVGYIPAEAVGVSTGTSIEEMDLSAEMLDTIGKSSDGTGILLGSSVTDGSGSSAGANNGGIPAGSSAGSKLTKISPGSQTFAVSGNVTGGISSIWLKGSSGSTAAWYGIENSEGALPSGSRVGVRWFSGNDSGSEGPGSLIQNDPMLSGRYNSDSGNIFVVSGSLWGSGTNDRDIKISTGNDRVNSLIGNNLTEKITDGSGQRLYVYPISSGGYESLAAAN